MKQNKIANMKGKNVFSQSEYDELERLVIRRVNAPSSHQKRIRDQMRALGFYGRDDFGITDLRIEDLRRLRKSGRVVVIGRKLAPISTPKSINSVTQNEKALQMADNDVESWVESCRYSVVSSLRDIDVPDKPGLYCMKLLKGSGLPIPFDQYAQSRNNIIYIGLASQSLRQRMWNQELHHKSAATFFRSLGAVLGYRPEFGSLIGMKNQNNYEFSEEDKQSIIEWIEQNIEVGWICISDNLNNLETELIHKFTPVINIDKNPAKVSELIQLREECRQIARGNTLAIATLHIQKHGFDCIERASEKNGQEYFHFWRKATSK